MTSSQLAAHCKAVSPFSGSPARTLTSAPARISTKPVSRSRGQCPGQSLRWCSSVRPRSARAFASVGYSCNKRVSVSTSPVFTARTMILTRFDITCPGMSPAEFPPISTAPERPWRWRLLWPGRVTEEKGAQTAIKAMGLLPAEAVFEIVGPVEPAYQRLLQQMAATLGAAERLTFTLASRQEMRAHYQRADATLFTSMIEHEAFGLVPLEAMASGCPVVATCVGGSGEYCLDGVNCLRYAVGEAGSLALAIQQLAANPALRQRLIEGGLRTARELTLDRQAKQI
jgi:glycosyltransferase involved in cell wall biosynthesis